MPQARLQLHWSRGALEVGIILEERWDGGTANRTPIQFGVEVILEDVAQSIRSDHR